jgi:hypothetical protein
MWPLRPLADTEAVNFRVRWPFSRKMFVMRKLLLCVLFYSLQATAWWDTPHMLVAQIAYDHMRPEVRMRADELIAIHAQQYPKTNDFVTASLWADDIRGQGDKTYSSWHYVTLTFQDVNEPLPTRASFPEKYHVSWAIENEIAILQDPKKTEADKGLALRRLIHWAGDIHQPLHATTHISAHYPKGDTGGNLFLVDLPKPLHNLHSLWDSGLDHWEDIDRPLTPEGKALLAAEAKHLQQQYGRSHLGSMNPYDWAIHSHELARQHVYTGIEYKGIPSAAYIAQGVELTDKQVTLAGQRLGKLLNEVFSP